MNTSLFDSQIESSPQTHPLAYQLAPKTLNDYIGQDHIVGKGKPLRNLIENDQLFSMVLWGPPGCGKTSLSRLISAHTKAHYLSINAVTAKVADIKQAIETAKLQLTNKRRTILFIDEIHRFNKAQQDALLPEVETGLITMIGATTENPFFSVIPGLISRCQIYEFKPLTQKNMKVLIQQALKKISLKLEPKAVDRLIQVTGGDARKCINLLELLDKTHKEDVTEAHINNLLQSEGYQYNLDTHYDLASAYIKSMRASQPDAALYWLARMLEGGEPPEFIARRCIIFASEDIGNADPTALTLATSLLQAVKFVGLPEVQINLGHVTTYLASAPKSNASYIALKHAQSYLKSGKRFAVPEMLKDSHYSGAKKMGYGDDYQYPHDYPHAVTNQEYLPEKTAFYQPTEHGYEGTIKKRLDFHQSIRGKHGKTD